MNLEWLLSKMSDEERTVFFETNDYYRYITQLEEFKIIQEKLNQQEVLTEEEWHFMISKLFLVYCHSMNQIEDFDFTSHFFSFIAKLGIKLGKKHGQLYNECYKIRELIWNYEVVSELQEDLLVGIEQLIRGKKEEDLRNLLNQYQLNQIFLDTKKAYEEAYHTTRKGELSPNEKLYIHATHHAYEEEKKLVKKYQKSHH